MQLGLEPKKSGSSTSAFLDNNKPLTLLTVGDGDLSASLAIMRAYNNTTMGSVDVVIHHLVATTIVSCRKALVETYPSSAPAILGELESDAYADRVTIVYNVDATQLHTYSKLITLGRRFDMILFHHPHLGYDRLASSSQEHAARHAALLAHYFYSARCLLLLLSDVGNVYIHVCLCSGSVQSWSLDDTVEHLDLEYVFDSPRAASRPLLEGILGLSDDNNGKEEDSTTAATSTTIATSKQQRKKKGGGSRKGHWLGRYGYRHKPTFPQVTEFQSNVSSSIHYFVRPKNTSMVVALMDETDGGADTGTNDHRCGICRQVFADSSALQAHLLSPALPTLS